MIELTVLDLLLLIMLANVVTDLFAVIVDTLIGKYERYKKKKKLKKQESKECDTD